LSDFVNYYEVSLLLPRSTNRGLASPRIRTQTLIPGSTRLRNSPTCRTAWPTSR